MVVCQYLYPELHKIWCCLAAAPLLCRKEGTKSSVLSCQSGVKSKTLEVTKLEYRDIDIRQSLLDLTEIHKNLRLKVP